MTIYFITMAGLVFLVSAIYAQSALSELLDFFRNSPSLLEKTGFISDLYFLYDLTRCRYGFVRYLFKHPVPPKEIADAFPDYSRLRNISNVVYGLHVVFGIVLIAAFVIHQCKCVTINANLRNELINWDR